MSRIILVVKQVTADAAMEDQHIDSCLSDLHRLLTATAAPLMSCYQPARIMSVASGEQAS